MNLQSLIKTDMEVEEKLLRQYEQALAKAPRGRLSYKRIKHHIYYYLVDEDTGKQRCISRSERKLIYQLKLKKQMTKTIEILKCNLKWQRKLLEHYLPYDAASVEGYFSAAYTDVSLKEYEKQWIVPKAEWTSAPFPSNPYYEEGRHLQTSFGLMVRSKSEVVIAELLHAAGIPFRYEAELRLRDRHGKEKRYYPDFTILTPQGKIVYWEHYGLFQDERYRERFLEKTDTYYHNGIVQPDNYIVTMDGPGGSLDTAAIHRIIEGQLMPLFR